MLIRLLPKVSVLTPPFTFTVLMSIAATGSAYADTFEDAVAAYQSGEKVAAFRLLNQASDEGNDEATFQLARMLHNGDGVPRNLTKAVALYEQLAKADNPKGLYSLGLLYVSGDGVPRDIERAATLMGKSAEAGLVYAQRNYANMLLDGEGVEKNLTAAASWMSKAADQGDAVAQRLYGLMLISGNGTEKDEVAGIQLMAKAATAGDADSQCFIGRYFNRDGPDHDLKLAVEYYRLSAEQGNDCGQYHYGHAHQNGIVVERDDAKAELLYRSASDQGYAQAKYALAVLLVDKEGSDARDFQAAQALLIDAGKGGIGPSYLLIASLIAKTQGESGAVDAYAWALISQASGYVDEEGLTARLERHLSSAKTEAASLRARDLVAEYEL